MKKLRYLAILLAAAFAFSGCNIIKVNPERDGAQVVAEVNGEKITKKQVYDAINLTWDKKIDSWDVTTVQNEKEQAMENMIAQKVILLKAKDQGMYNFTADEQKTIADNVASYTKTTYDAALKKYQDAAKTDSSIKPEDKANADVDAYLKSLGTTRDELKKQEEDSMAFDKLKKTVTDPVTPKDTDVQTEYNTETTSQKTTYDATPTQAVTDDNNGTTIVYYPNDGFIRVRQILIPLPDDIQTQISTDRKNGDTTGADKLRTDELKKIEAAANDYLTKAKAANGDLTKLDQLIKDSGDKDPGMDSKPEGYLVVKDTTAYVQDFTNAALALTTVGQPSELVASDFGYHIIWISQKPVKGNVPFDQVKDKLTASVKSTQQDTAWSNAVTSYMDEYKAKISRYTSRLNN